MDKVIYEKKGPVSIIRFNRPEKLNALDLEVRRTLLELMRRSEGDDEVASVVLTGEGKAFCVGADLSTMSQDIYRDLRETFYPLVLGIRRSRKIYISAVNGVTAGACISLVLASDIRLVGKGAKFVTAFHKIGLAPDTGFTYFLSRLGGGRFMENALVGKDITVEEFVSAGLGRTSESPLEEAVGIGQEIAKGPRRAYAVSKDMINKSLFWDLEDYLHYEATAQAYLAGRGDFHEGVRAFNEKRPAKFNGE